VVNPLTLVESVRPVFQSRLIVRLGKRVLQAGVMIQAAAFVLQLMLLKPGAGSWLIVLLMGAWGFGNGLVLPSLLNIALRSVPPEHAGAAAGIYSTFQQTASALGISIIGGIFFYFAQQGWQTAYTYGIMVILVCTVLVGLMLYLLPDGKPAAAQTLHAE